MNMQATPSHCEDDISLTTAINATLYRFINFRQLRTNLNAFLFTREGIASCFLVSNVDDEFDVIRSFGTGENYFSSLADSSS